MTAVAILTKGVRRIVTYPTMVVRARGQIWTLVKRELRGRYLSSVFGGIWTVINPLILLLVYYFVFAKILPIKFKQLGFADEDVSAGFFLFCGMVPWMAFAEGLQRSTNIIIENANLIKKVAFPSEILPIYVVLYTFINEMIGVAILLIALLVFGGKLHFVMLWFPVFAILKLILTLGFSYLLAALNVFVRDVMQVIGLVLTLGMFVTPIFYQLRIVPEEYHKFYRLNPMMYVIKGYRDIFLEGITPDLSRLIVFIGMSLGVFVLGYGFFAATKHKFADEV